MKSEFSAEINKVYEEKGLVKFGNKIPPLGEAVRRTRWGFLSPTTPNYIRATSPKGRIFNFQLVTLQTPPRHVVLRGGVRQAFNLQAYN